MYYIIIGGMRHTKKKMRTRYSRLDMNKDDFISREDYKKMAKKVAEFGKLNKRDASAAEEAFMAIADKFDLKPGVCRFTIEEASQKLHDKVLTTPDDQKKALLQGTHTKMFDAFDTNKDGPCFHGRIQGVLQGACSRNQ